MGRAFHEAPKRSPLNWPLGVYVPHMSEGLPAALRPPVALALARAVESIPRADALPGGCLYEPNWDGFRVCAVVGTDGISLWSRQGKDLTRYSVGVKRRRADLWPSESAVISAR
jgi:ATP-dependent DNA ligase